MIISQIEYNLTEPILALIKQIIELIPILIFYAIIIVPIVIISKKKKQKSKQQNKTNNNIQTIEELTEKYQNITTQVSENTRQNILNSEIQTNWSECYEPINLLTRNEWQQYKVIDKWADTNKLKILVKVRLADLIKPRSGKNSNNSLFWKIQAKHIDFVITDKNLRVIAIVELLDNSHKTPERQERDDFVKQVLTSCGYKVLFTYAPTEEQLNKLCGIKTIKYEQEQIPLQ